MSRNARIVRVLRIIRMLEAEPKGYTPAEIGAKFGVSSKTSRRDLDALRAAGINIVETSWKGQKAYAIAAAKTAAPEPGRPERRRGRNVTPLLTGGVVTIIGAGARAGEEGSEEKKPCGKLPHQYPWLD